MSDQETSGSAEIKCILSAEIREKIAEAAYAKILEIAGDTDANTADLLSIAEMLISSIFVDVMRPSFFEDNMLEFGSQCLKRISVVSDGRLLTTASEGHA